MRREHTSKAREADHETRHAGLARRIDAGLQQMGLTSTVPSWLPLMTCKPSSLN